MAFLKSKGRDLEALNSSRIDFVFDIDDMPLPSGVLNKHEHAFYHCITKGFSLDLEKEVI